MITRDEVFTLGMQIDWPITLAVAARRLRWRRGMRALAKICQRERIGLKVARSNAARMLFESDFNALCEAIRCLCVCTAETESGTSAGPSEVALVARLRAHLKDRSPRRTGRSGRRSYLKERSSENVLLFRSGAPR